MKIFEERIKTNVENEFIEFDITYIQPRRFYQLTAVPVKIIKRDGFSMKEFGAYTGFVKSLNSVANKRSAKSDDEAVALFKDKRKEYLEWFVKNKGVIIPELEAVSSENQD